jgi:hypothetical protein
MSREDEIRARVENLYESGKQKRPRGFEEALFLASVGPATMQPGGDLTIKLTIPHAERGAAMPLMDAAGILVLIHAKRQPIARRRARRG